MLIRRLLTRDCPRSRAWTSTEMALSLVLIVGLSLPLVGCGSESEGDDGTDTGCNILDPTSCPPGFICTIVPPSTDFQCAPDSSGTPDAGVDVVEDTDPPDDVTPDSTPDGGQPDGSPDTEEEVEPVGEDQCDDGVDNDDDGQTDCADSDCIGDEACPTTETDCADGVDNDNDGQTDCADTLDCGATPTCPESNCGDRTDNNNDGLVDCADPTCTDVAPCGAETTAAVCADGIDNDNDGDVDCDDDECFPLDICIVDYDAWIAYQAPGESGLDTVFLLASDGSAGPLLVEDGLVIARAPAFSPDGTRLAYAFSNADGQRIRVLDLTTGVRTDYAQDSLSAVNQPSWSPDGTQLAVQGRVGAGEGAQDIFIITLAGDVLSSPLTSVAEGRFVSNPVFSADGSTVYFIEGVPGQVENPDESVSEIWSVPVDGTAEAEAVTTDANPFGRINISPNGERIVFRALPVGLRIFNTTDNSVIGLSGSDEANSPAFFGRTDRLVASIPRDVAGRQVADLVLLDANNGSEISPITTTADAREGSPAVSPVALDAFPIVIGE